MAISFANFGKYSQWVRLANNAPQGQQMNYLRFYAHNSGKSNDYHGDKLIVCSYLDLKSLVNSPTVYEITEQVTDPVRCPIKQYDYYVSKWYDLS